MHGLLGTDCTQASSFGHLRSVAVPRVIITFIDSSFRYNHIHSNHYTEVRLYIVIFIMKMA